MGTRHIIQVKHEGKIKVSQYGQWDGQPSGQGVSILAFLRTEFNREKFLTGLAKTYEPTQEQIDVMDATLERLDATVPDLYPSLSRDTGSDILGLIQNTTEPLPLILADEDHKAAALYGYLIDLDDNVFEFCSEPPPNWSLAALPTDEAFIKATMPEDD